MSEPEGKLTPIELNDCVCTCGHYAHFQDGTAGCTEDKCPCFKYEADYQAEANRQLKDIMGQVFKELEKSCPHHSEIEPSEGKARECEICFEALKSKWGIK